MQGMEVHHMLVKNKNSFHLYTKLLQEFGPILEQLANDSSVIWLNQYPIVDFYGKISSENTAIHSEKVYYYNEAVRHIFK